MSILKRHLAPITEGAWDEINEQARETLSAHLSGRRLVTVTGPLGWEASAVNLGRLSLAGGGPVDGVNWGVREVQPLLEYRVPFELDMWELDNVERGSRTPDLGALEAAARKVAHFEDEAIFHGCEKGGMTGLIPAGEHEARPLGEDVDAMLTHIEDVVFTLHTSGVEGPYNVVLGGAPYRMLMSGAPGCFPIRQRVLDLLEGGGIYWSSALKRGVVMSSRGGDFELTLGVDVSIGYASHTSKRVQLYLTGSFTFRVHEPKALIAFS